MNPKFSALNFQAYASGYLTGWGWGRGVDGDFACACIC